MKFYGIFRDDHIQGIPKQIYRIMKLTTFLLFVFFVQVSAATNAQITLSLKNESMRKALKNLSKQSGYDFIYADQDINLAKPISIKLQNVSLEKALELCFINQPLVYQVADKTVMIKRREEKGIIEKIIDYFQSIDVSGQITGENGEALAGASVTVKGTNRIVTTNQKGEFSFTNIDEKAILVISYVGYQTREVAVKKAMGEIKLVLATAKLDEVSIVNTGYQTLPKERATGSFVQIDNATLNQQVSPDILSRLEAVTSGLMVERNATVSRITIRGLSTIRGPKEVLVVVDNFPYDGDINNINPNDVENITILRDAAASSIWGARAGNGVIVITTKKGKVNQKLTVSLNVNATVKTIPELERIKGYISAADFISVEKMLFDKGYYNSSFSSTSRPYLSPVVELLRDKATATDQQKLLIDQQIEKMGQVDARNEYRDFMYKTGLQQQYALNLSGGTTHYGWTSSVGYDNNSGNLYETNDRLTLRFQQVYQPIKHLSITTGLQMTNTSSRTGRPGFGAASPAKGTGFIPYMQFQNEDGSSKGFSMNISERFVKSYSTNTNLQDWLYYPLEDYKHEVTSSKGKEMMLNFGANYAIGNGFGVDIKYLYQSVDGSKKRLADQYSYFSRNLINRFTQLANDGTAIYNVPRGGILDDDRSEANIHNLRGQLSYERKWKRSEVNMIVGGELRTRKNEEAYNRFYGYNDQLSTTSSVNYTILYPNLVNGASSLIDYKDGLNSTSRNNLSSFANASYTFDGKYTLSASARTDASNLFGLRTNEQWNPFWSTGISWKISDEKFYQISWMNTLKLRATYGFSGNVDPSMAAVTTLRYISYIIPETGQNYARFSNFENRDLKWETSRMINIGADFSLLDNKIHGSLEYYHKKGTDLFGDEIIDYTVGVGTSLRKNVATMRGSGWDFSLSTKPLGHRFKWQSTLNISLNRNEVEDYYQSNVIGSNYVNSAGNITGMSGLPVHAIFSYYWAGLDPQTGDPQGYANGDVSKNYSLLTGSTIKIQDLQYHGSATPTWFGTWNNSFSYQRLRLSLAITFKGGYYFSRSSINYSSLFSSWLGHADFTNRWQNPGDELWTNVPSMIYPASSARERFYSGSAALVDRGDHLRLQYIRLDYELQPLLRSFGRYFEKMQLYANVANLGTIWKRTKLELDPEYETSFFNIRPSVQFSFGVNFNF